MKISFLKDSKGIALVELALVLPALLLLVFGSLELTKMFQAYQLISSISRESANQAFRDCTVVSGTSACVAAVGSQMDQLASQVAPGVGIILSVYRLNSSITPNPVNRIAFYTNDAAINNSNFQTSFGSVSDVDSFPLAAVNDNKRTIAIAEIFYDYTGFFSIAERLNLVKAGTFYEPTIY